MAGHPIPYFSNDAGHATISVGVKEFMCCGANPPHDHPHVFLDMGDEGEIVCPYCSTHYIHDSGLSPHDATPSECEFKEAAA